MDIANARAIYGPTRHLDIISFAHRSSRRIGAAIVEHNPTGRSYIHCSSAKEGTRLGAYEHLLVITEDILQELMDKEGISSSGWLPSTPQSQHAATYTASLSGSMAGSALPSLSGSVPPSRRSSVQPPEHSHATHYGGQEFLRQNSDHIQQSPLALPRTNSDIIQTPKPVPVGRFPNGGRVSWNLGSES
ncbi:hypothetical protein CC78DRAFT_45232 [Lojkania enalia]|uniref:Uncharacterized protein n=1 Tax=Lojkania enalia TaxID=147567 RepID=A0A9P4K1R3_9PLEO|nr:hypothetical protein CC78DRAFT_45232 [Didymosphaeria enalia]